MINILFLCACLFTATLSGGGDSFQADDFWCLKRGVTITPQPFGESLVDSYWDAWKVWQKHHGRHQTIVDYVHELSSRDQGAASWFLITGGKYGFSKRRATARERSLLIESFEHVATTLSDLSEDQSATIKKTLVQSSLDYGPCLYKDYAYSLSVRNRHLRYLLEIEDALRLRRAHQMSGDLITNQETVLSLQVSSPLSSPLEKDRSFDWKSYYTLSVDPVRETGEEEVTDRSLLILLDAIKDEDPGIYDSIEEDSKHCVLY